MSPRQALTIIPQTREKVQNDRRKTFTFTFPSPFPLGQQLAVYDFSSNQLPTNWHTSGRNQNVNKKGVELWSLSFFPPGSSLQGFHLPFSSQSRAGDLRPGWLIINHLPIFCISSCQFLSLPFRFFCSSGLVLESLISGLSPWSVCPKARCMLPSPSSCRTCPPCCYDEALSGPIRWTFPRFGPL